MARKVLASVQTSSNWSSLAGALEGVLRSLGLTLSRERVMGLSGHAFRLAIATGPQGLAAGQEPVCPVSSRGLALYENLGVRWQQLGVEESNSDYDQLRRRAINAITRSLDHRRPVVASGLQGPDFGIVKGYDDRAQVFYVSTAVSSQYGEMLPLAQWPAPGSGRSFEILLAGDRRRVDARQAEMAALRFAVDYAEHGDPDAVAGAASGLQAYALWLTGFEETGRLDRFGNCRVLQRVQAARRDAALFVRDLLTVYSPPMQRALAAAVSAYEQEALAFSRLATLFPFPNGGSTDSPALLALGAAGLRAALAHERTAIDALKAALAAQ
jgi:hypothetical protein